MKTTILIPEYGHPNFLEVCIEALIRNSRYKHDILVVGGDIEAAAADFQYKKSGERYQKYNCIKDFLTQRRKWLEDNNVTFIDTTERRKEFKAQYERNVGLYQGGVDTAFNDNIGAELVKTKWFFWNWDDDFIAAPDWDVNLLRYMDGSRHDKVYLPTHVQPAVGNSKEIMCIDQDDVWTTGRHISIHRLPLPITSRTAAYLLESELNAFVRTNSRDGTWEELCGVRYKIHWVPMLIEKSFYLSIGGCNYQGPGYDIEFDDRLGKLGISKIMSRSSFIIHRGYMIWEEEE